MLILQIVTGSEKQQAYHTIYRWVLLTYNLLINVVGIKIFEQFAVQNPWIATAI